MGAKSWLSIAMLPGFYLLLFPQRGRAQDGSGSQPVRHQAQYTRIYFDDFEGAPAIGPGLQLLSPSNPPGQVNSALVTTDPSLIIAGKASVRLGWFGKIVTNPSVLPLAGNNTYIVEFQYHILNYGATSDILHLNLQPAGTSDPSLQVDFSYLGKNIPATGTFSSGAYLAPASTSYVLTITSQQQTDLVIDNFAVYRQDTLSTSTTPPTWANLETLPFPRLGKYQNSSYAGYAAGAPSGSPYTLDFIEKTVAFFDVVFGVPIYTQTELPAEIRRARQLNPNAVILPYRIAEEQTTNPPTPRGANVDLEYQFLKAVPDSWYLKDTKGHIVTEQHYPEISMVDVSPSCPTINGQTYISALMSWLNGKVFPSGEWDGVFFDNLFGSINTDLLNIGDPALFDVDINRNGIRDDSPASVSEMARNGAITMLQQLRQTNGDQQLILGNVGGQGLAPYVNGFLLECVNYLWNSNFGTTVPGKSPVSWRIAFDQYRKTLAASRHPRITAFEGCGSVYGFEGSTPGQYPTPTAEDILSHRFTMGTALLDNGFYGFDLHGGISPPLWYDEYSVDSTGTAVEDRAKKGYLGKALGDAVELTDGGSAIFQETFDSGALPASFAASPGPAPGAVYVSQAPGDVIGGAGSLVISNPDHTKRGFVAVGTNPKVLALNPSNTYVVSFDWRILETLDSHFRADIVDAAGQAIDSWLCPEVVAGDFGTAHFPFQVTSAGAWSIRFAVSGGGGKVAMDNVRVTLGGAGPWRRDFENGFVLVNPFSQPHTFSASDVAGSLKRTGVHRIKGTQAADINNGQPVTGDFTLGAFDGIILLADPIRASIPIINGVSNAAGGQPGVASGAFVSIYGSGFTPLAYDDWGKSIANGQLPAQLDGISVSIGGKPAYINAITPGQINVQAPELGNGTVQVVVTTPGGASAPFTVNSQLYSPAFFPWPGNQPVATHADYSFAVKNGTFPGTTTVPANPGEIITLWGTGFGPTNPPVAAGQEPTVQAPPTALPVSVTLGGVPVPVIVRFSAAMRRTTRSQSRFRPPLRMEPTPLWLRSTGCHRHRTWFLRCNARNRGADAERRFWTVDNSFPDLVHYMLSL